MKELKKNNVREVDVQFHAFLTSARVGDEMSVSRPCNFTSEESDPDARWREGWVRPGVEVDDMEKLKFFTLTGLELLPLGHPACNHCVE
jgi:hypothetical protein